MYIEGGEVEEFHVLRCVVMEAVMRRFKAFNTVGR